MADLDLDNLSPEDKAMFDAMVAEEMRKLEEQFQSEANAMAENNHEPPPSSYAPSVRPPPMPREKSSSHFDDYSSEKAPFPRQPQRRDDNSLNPDRLAYKSPEWNNEDEILVGKGGRAMGIGRHQSKEEKRLKQQEYAAQLNEGVLARKTATSPRDRHSAAASKRAEGGVSVSRSAGSQRASEDEARRQKIQAQQKYAMELQEQQSARQKADQIPENRDRKRVQRRAQSPIQQSSILSSPTSTYTSAAGRNNRGGGAPMTDREKARQKQAEYYRQLEADKQVALLASPQSPDRSRAISNRSQNPTQHQRMASPINRERGQLSERDLKHQRQQEYAQQLKLDMQQNTSLESNRRGYNNSRSETSLSKAPSKETDLGINFGGGRPQLSRREKQEEYARQIREAAEQKEISTPRRALSARRQGNSPHQDKFDQNNGTGLSFGSDVATAAQRASKRDRQNKYREELESGLHSKPIPSSRVSLHSHRCRQDEELGVRGGGPSGFSTAGLIGNQESEHEKLRKKRESQREYYEQLRGQSPTKDKQSSREYDNNNGDYSKPMTREADVTFDKREPLQEHSYSPTQDNYNDQYESNAPLSELSRRLAQAYHDPYEQQQPPSTDGQYSENSHHRVSLPRDDSFDMLEKMRVDSQSRIMDEDHYSPTRRQQQPVRRLEPVRSEDGNLSFDGINPPYGRFNKGMNVPDGEGNLPSARQPQRQHYQQHQQQQQQQQQYQDEQDYKEQQYLKAHQGTSLTIGEMDIQTAEGRERKAYEQQKYVQDLEREKNRAPIQSERVSLIQQKKYLGNGLPGSNVPQQQQGGGNRRGFPSPQQQLGQGHYAGHRGTSTGGGASSVVLGGGYGAEGSPRMQRKGGRDEYAKQLHNQQEPQELYQQHQQYYQQSDYGGR